MSSTVQQLQAGWQEFLRGVAWKHTMTVTTRFPMSRVALRREIVCGLIRRLARNSQHAVDWFYAIEQTTTGHPHAHVLLAGTDILTASEIERAWKAGMTRVQALPSDADEAAVYAIAYVLKKVGHDPDDYDLARRWKYRRQSSVS